jgi:hypothetical protein
LPRGSYFGLARRHRGHDERSIAPDEELMTGALERQTAHQHGRRARHVDDQKLRVGHRDDAPAVGLDDVGLVDSRLLNVRGGEGGGLAARAHGGGGGAFST